MVTVSNITVMVTPEIIQKRLEEARSKRQEYERLVREADVRGRPADYKLAMDAAISYAAVQESAIALLYGAVFAGTVKAVK